MAHETLPFNTRKLLEKSLLSPNLRILLPHEVANFSPDVQGTYSPAYIYGEVPSLGHFQKPKQELVMGLITPQLTYDVLVMADAPEKDRTLWLKIGHLVHELAHADSFAVLKNHSRYLEKKYHQYFRHIDGVPYVYEQFWVLFLESYGFRRQYEFYSYMDKWYKTDAFTKYLLPSRVAKRLRHLNSVGGPSEAQLVEAAVDAVLAIKSYGIWDKQVVKLFRSRSFSQILKNQREKGGPAFATLPHFTPDLFAMAGIPPGL